MSRRLWRCRNPECGAVLGRITSEGGLVLDSEVRQIAAYFDTGKAVIGCPVCGTMRQFRGPAVAAVPRP